MNLGFNDAHRSQSLKEFLVPSLVELVVLIILGATLLLLLSHNAIWTAASTDAGVSGQVASRVAQPQLAAVSDFLSQEVFAKATVFLLWGCIGAVAYTAIGALIHFAASMNQDVRASKYVAPKTASNYWLARISQYLYFAATLFLFLLFVSILVASILPIASEWMSQTILSYQVIATYTNALLALAVTTLCLYILSRLWNVLSYSFHITFRS